MSTVVHVAERDGHSTLRLALETGGAECEAFPVIVEIELLWAVIVREIDVGPAVFIEVGSGGRERPPSAAESELVGDVLELAMSEIVEHQILAAVRGELEAVVHDSSRREMPQIDVAAEVSGHVEIEQAVAVVVDPDRVVAVHPAVQSSGLGHVAEVVSVDVLEQRQVPVPIDQKVFATVVVEVTPHAAHRHAFARSIEISEAGARRDLFECSVAAIVVQRVRFAEAAVCEIQVGPAVAVEIGDGHRRAQRGDVRLDVGDLWIERRAMVHEVDAGRGGLVVQHEARSGSIGRRERRAAVESHRGENRRDERDGDDRAPHARV